MGLSQVIVLGEDLTRFRNASKLLYRFLHTFSWNGRVQSKLAVAFAHPAAIDFGARVGFRRGEEERRVFLDWADGDAQAGRYGST